MFVAHVRSFLARHRAVHWVVVGSLALGTAAIVASRATALDRARRSWGEAQSVWVAAGDFDPGDPVVVRTLEAPLALVPAAAIDIDANDPSELTARRRVRSGEILVADDVSGVRSGAGAAGGPGDLGGLVPPGWRQVAVPADESTLPVLPGDRVEVMAAGVVLATDGVVVAVRPAAVIVAVPAESAADVAAAAVDRSAVLAAHG